MSMPLVNGGPSKMATAGLSTTEYFERLESLRSHLT